MSLTNSVYDGMLWKKTNKQLLDTPEDSILKFQMFSNCSINWTYDDVCRLALKVEESKGKKSVSRWPAREPQIVEALLVLVPLSRRPPAAANAPLTAKPRRAPEGGSAGKQAITMLQVSVYWSLTVQAECPNRQIVSLVEDGILDYDESGDEHAGLESDAGCLCGIRGLP